MVGFRYLCVGLMVAMGGCATEKSVVFVTKTSLSVLDVDSTPYNLSIAYDRIEGYVGPRYEDGTMPPVYASIQSDGGIFTPRVRQLYATGNAAVIAANGADVQARCIPVADPKNDINAANNCTEKFSSSQKPKPMFFGTTTTTGLKIGTTGNLPDSFTFGFKRKEFSYIPVGTIGGFDYYPSVVASIDTAAVVSVEESAVKLDNTQFFATGTAAEHVAYNLRSVFASRGQQSLGVHQRAESASALKCYVGVPVVRKVKVWEDADRRHLFHESEDTKDGEKIINQLKARYEKAAKTVPVDATVMAEADKIYATSIFMSSDTDSERMKDLELHTAAVCMAARISS